MTTKEFIIFFTIGTVVLVVEAVILISAVGTR